MNYSLAKRLRSVVEHWIHLHSPSAILQFPWSAWEESLTTNHNIIKNEVLHILNHQNEITNFNDVLPGQRALQQDSKWKSFFIKALGQNVTKHQELCPFASKIINEIPDVINAFFSIIGPGVYIPPHRGPYAGILRYHYGIIVPEGDLGIKVDGTTCRWEERKGFFFDDSFEHEAWNYTNEVRVILFLDIVRPLPFPLNIANRFLLRVFSKSHAAKQGYSFVMKNQI